MLGSLTHFGWFCEMPKVWWNTCHTLVTYRHTLGSVHLKSVGGGMQIPYWIWGGGPSKFCIGFGGGSCKFRIRGKKTCDATFLHFTVQYLTGTPFRYCVEGGVKGEVASGSVPLIWI